MTRTFILLASILGATGVGLGAFGAHGLQAVLEANGRLDTFETANRYHMYHVLALIGVAWLTQYLPGRLINIAGYALFAGALIFSGSLYLLAVFDLRIMGAIALIGGTLLIVGWLCIALAAWQIRER